MKKTLIALATLAAASGAFAQSVTLSGAVGFGYSKDATTKGYEMTDGNFQLTAKEDLGGGLSVTGAMKVDSVFGRQTTSPTNADATVTLAGNGFSVMMGSFESTADARKGDVSGISLEQGLDKSNYNLATTNVDGIVASYALMPGVSVGVAHVEVPNSPTITAGTSGQTVDSNTATLGDVTAATKLTKVFASYANGPMSVFVSNAKTSAAGAKGYTQVGASYDLGVAKVGMGYRTKGGDADNTTLFSASVPMGAFSLGIATAEYNGVRGTVYGVNYSLSKTTTIYASRQVSDAAALDASYRIKLVKAF